MQTQSLSEQVEVWFKDYPRLITWKNRDYKVTKVGFHHKYKQGKTLFHIFSVVSGTIFLRLKLNTNNLKWKLDGINDTDLTEGEV